MDLDNPGRSIERSKQMLDKVGGRLVNSWATLGRFDFIMVVEVPDATAVRALVATVPAYIQTETARAFDGMAVDKDFVSLMKKIVSK
jgi:uncharacterized protein with GYD domain